jgi:hypothetical protein
MDKLQYTEGVALEYAFILSEQESKSTEKQFIKLSEEVGELANDILCESGDNAPEKAGDDGASGECIDIALMAISLFIATGGTREEWGQAMLDKGMKWETQIHKNNGRA